MLSKISGLFVDLFSYTPMYVQYLIIPLILFIWLWKSKNKCKADWILKVLPSVSYMIVMLYAGSTDITIGYYTFYLLFVVVIVGAVFSLLKLKGVPFFIKKSLPGYLLYGLSITIVLIVSYMNINALRACFYGEKAVKIAFPLKNGSFIVNQGGDGDKSSMMNYHYKDAGNAAQGYNGSMRYANDIVKINSFGLSVKSFKLSLNNKDFLPADLNEYEIFGETVYSPCDGVVVYAQNNYKDVPVTGVKNYSDTGNGVVIYYNDVYIMMWHLKQGSITVKAGDHVTTGQPVGQIGNSGHTVLPHLHIDASKGDWLTGTGVPIVFDGIVPIKRKLFIR